MTNTIQLSSPSVYLYNDVDYDNAAVQVRCRTRIDDMVVLLHHQSSSSNSPSALPSFQTSNVTAGITYHRDSKRAVGDSVVIGFKRGYLRDLAMNPGTYFHVEIKVKEHSASIRFVCCKSKLELCGEVDSVYYRDLSHHLAPGGINGIHLPIKLTYKKTSSTHQTNLTELWDHALLQASLPSPLGSRSEAFVVRLEKERLSYKNKTRAKADTLKFIDYSGDSEKATVSLHINTISKKSCVPYFITISALASPVPIEQTSKGVSVPLSSAKLNVFRGLYDEGCFIKPLVAGPFIVYSKPANLNSLRAQTKKKIATKRIVTKKMKGRKSDFPRDEEYENDGDYEDEEAEYDEEDYDACPLPSPTTYYPRAGDILTPLYGPGCITPSRPLAKSRTFFSPPSRVPSAALSSSVRLAPKFGLQPMLESSFFESFIDGAIDSCLPLSPKGSTTIGSWMSPLPSPRNNSRMNSPMFLADMTLAGAERLSPSTPARSTTINSVKALETPDTPSLSRLVEKATDLCVDTSIDFSFRSSIGSPDLAELCCDASFRLESSLSIDSTCEGVSRFKPITIDSRVSRSTSPSSPVVETSVLVKPAVVEAAQYKKITPSITPAEYPSYSGVISPPSFAVAASAAAPRLSTEHLDAPFFGSESLGGIADFIGSPLLLKRSPKAGPCDKVASKFSFNERKRQCVADDDEERCDLEDNEVANFSDSISSLSSAFSNSGRVSAVALINSGRSRPAFTEKFNSALLRQVRDCFIRGLSCPSCNLPARILGEVGELKSSNSPNSVENGEHDAEEGWKSLDNHRASCLAVKEMYLEKYLEKLHDTPLDSARDRQSPKKKSRPSPSSNSLPTYPSTPKSSMRPFSTPRTRPQSRVRWEVFDPPTLFSAPAAAADSPAHFITPTGAEQRSYASIDYPIAFNADNTFPCDLGDLGNDAVDVQNSGKKGFFRGRGVRNNERPLPRVFKHISMDDEELMMKECRDGFF